MNRYPPEGIICLTEETVETLYLLGEDARIVGVSGYAVRPPKVRKEKPRISAFTSADIPKILALQPDLVLSFSDLQADIVADLIRAGVAVMAYNQRSIAGILAMIRHLGATIGCAERANALADSYEARLAQISAQTHSPAPPKIYFEEWDEPQITAIGWVSELIAIAGGRDVFAAEAAHGEAKGRIITSGAVIAAKPDIIIGSWCGKKVRPEKIAARPGWDVIPAVQNGHIHEIKSPLILQPGPAALTDGLDALAHIITVRR